MVTVPAFPSALQQQRITALKQGLSARFIPAVLDVDIAWPHVRTMFGFLTGGILSGLTEWKKH